MSGIQSTPRLRVLYNRCARASRRAQREQRRFMIARATFETESRAEYKRQGVEYPETDKERDDDTRENSI